VPIRRQPLIESETAFSPISRLYDRRRRKFLCKPTKNSVATENSNWGISVVLSVSLELVRKLKFPPRQDKVSQLQFLPEQLLLLQLFPSAN
jgi:hypothetical protein